MFFPYKDDNPPRRFAYANVAIIAANVLIFLGMQFLQESQMQRFVANYGFIPARIRQLSNPRLLVRTPVEAMHVLRRPDGRVFAARERGTVDLRADRSAILFSLFSSLFLHGGLLHVAGNMWFLWIFGDNIEDRLGSLRYVVFYLCGGLLATLCHYYTQPDSVIPVIGASGAVAAVLGAYAVTHPMANIRCLIFLLFFVMHVDLPAVVVLGFWFVQQLLEAMGTLDLGAGGGVAWWAHVGGFVTGALFMILADPDDRPSLHTRGHMALRPYAPKSPSRGAWNDFT